MVTGEAFMDEILHLLDVLHDSQHDALEAFAAAMASCIRQDGVIHVFGSGHSVGMGLDIRGRTGSLVPVHIMDMNDFVLRGGISLTDFRDKVNVFERRPGVASRLYSLYDIRPQDLFVVISNSGINGIVIDVAALAREHGHQVVVVTSMRHTLAENSRHPSGKKLYMFGDIVIDNCGPHGDALLQTEGDARVCSVSSICNNVIAQACAARCVELLSDSGYEPPVLNGNREHDDALKRKYEGRI